MDATPVIATTLTTTTPPLPLLAAQTIMMNVPITIVMNAVVDVTDAMTDVVVVIDVMTDVDVTTVGETITVSLAPSGKEHKFSCKSS